MFSEQFVLILMIWSDLIKKCFKLGPVRHIGVFVKHEQAPIAPKLT